MSFSEKLKNNNLDLWDKAHIKHPFVQSIQNGTLEFKNFKFYMIQDYKFLIEYCKVVSIAISKSNNFETMSFLSKLLDETLNSEMTLHENFCNDYGIKKTELLSFETAPSTQAYSNYLISTAYKFDTNIICCALLPCQWGYDEIGRKLGNNNTTNPDSFHKRWIDSYNNPEYQKITSWLINHVDSNEETIDNKIANNIFRISLENEFSFWNSSWEI
jgi:thiaminase/transcriptional activator TenA|tara:strand:- start:6369 stop:7016 length:648 start_codon:yes stop_codon:yes gene_type:complete